MSESENTNNQLLEFYDIALQRVKEKVKENILKDFEKKEKGDGIVQNLKCVRDYLKKRSDSEHISKIKKECGCSDSEHL